MKKRSAAPSDGAPPPAAERRRAPDANNATAAANNNNDADAAAARRRAAASSSSSFSSLRLAAARLLAAVPRAWRPLRYEDADLVIRALEPVAVALCVVLIGAAIAYYSAQTTPAIFERLGPLVGAAHTAFGLSLVYAFGRSYWHLLTTPPGTTRDFDPRALREAAAAAEREAAAAEAEAEAEAEGKGDSGARLAPLRNSSSGGGGGGISSSSSPSGWKWCDKCALPKPPLAHHCSVCRRCVLRADHHCVWFGNCLGFGNYRHFVLFLVYLSIGALYACVTTYAVHGEAAGRDPWRYRWHVVLALLSGGLSLAVAALLGWHAVCLYYGMGTLEMMDRVLGWHEEEESEEEESEEEEGEGEERRRQQQQPTKEQSQQQQERQQGAAAKADTRPPHVAVAHLRDYLYNLGFERNVRLAFDLPAGGEGSVDGWWWRWLRVHGAPRAGDGLWFERQGGRRRGQGRERRDGQEGGGDAGERKKGL